MIRFYTKNRLFGFQIVLFWEVILILRKLNAGHLGKFAMMSPYFPHAYGHVKGWKNSDDEII